MECYYQQHSQHGRVVKNQEMPIVRYYEDPNKRKPTFILFPKFCQPLQPYSAPTIISFQTFCYSPYYCSAPYKNQFSDVKKSCQPLPFNKSVITLKHTQQSSATFLLHPTIIPHPTVIKMWMFCHSLLLFRSLLLFGSSQQPYWNPPEDILFSLFFFSFFFFTLDITTFKKSFI